MNPPAVSPVIRIPPLTDVTIGAYTFAAIAAILAKAGVAEHGFARASWLALLVGAISSAPTVLTGTASTG